jgi:ribonuclease P protein component
MPKDIRLSQADFALLRKQKPHRVHGVYFSLTVYILPSILQGPRAAVVIAKKTITKAVTRNRIERKFREIVRIHKKTLIPQYAYIASVKKDIAQATYKEIQSDLQNLFERTASGGTMHRI